MSRNGDPLAGIASDALSGDKEMVGRFLKGILPIVRRISLSVLGSAHPDLEDSVQESLLATLKALPHFRFEGTVSHYVTKISLRQALAARRRRVVRWKRQESLDIQHESGASAPMNGWLPEDIELIEKLFDKLSKVQSEALFMRLILELSVDEIARLTAVSSETVKTRLRRAKDALRKELVVPFWKRWSLRSRGDEAK